jgi:hypothetical protein
MAGAGSGSIVPKEAISPLTSSNVTAENRYILASLDFDL